MARFTRVSFAHLLNIESFCNVNIIVSVPYQETWTEIEKLCDKGLAKNIGMRFVLTFIFMN